MRKTGLAISALLLILVGLFIALLSGTSAKDANSQPVEIVLDDTFER